jgi:hypothetical protein
VLPTLFQDNPARVAIKLGRLEQFLSLLLNGIFCFLLIKIRQHLKKVFVRINTFPQLPNISTGLAGVLPRVGNTDTFAGATTVRPTSRGANN